MALQVCPKFFFLMREVIYDNTNLCRRFMCEVLTVGNESYFAPQFSHVYHILKFLSKNRLFGLGLEVLLKEHLLALERRQSISVKNETAFELHLLQELLIEISTFNRHITVT